MLIETARSLIGVPWKHRGMTATGVDCIGLVLYSMKAAGLLPDGFEIKAYSTYPKPELLLRELSKVATQSGTPRPGGIIFFGRKNLVHIAIMSGPNKFIHADSKHGRVAEVPWTAPWDKYAFTFWEFN